MMPTRREFLRRTTLIAGASAAAPGLLAAYAPSLRLGGPVFEKTDDPEALALAHRKLGYRAAYCPDVKPDDPDRIKAVREAFARHDVALAEVGAWCNLLDADAGKREANLKKVSDGLALAEEIGARCCVNIAGSFNPKQWDGPHPDNFSKKYFDATVENARKIIDAVKPRQAKFTFEMMGWAMPESPDRCLDLIKAVDREAFGVHLDPCNIICSPERYYRTTDLLHECFDKLGKWVAGCHAKDVTWKYEGQIHIRETCPGTGVLDYETYLKRLAELPQNPPLLIEHMKGPAEYDKARKYILETGKKAGLSFE